MARFTKAALLTAILGLKNVSSFVPNANLPNVAFKSSTNNYDLQMSTTDFNSVKVAKTGGKGAVSAAQEAVDKNLSLGAPGDRPKGGHFLTRGGVQVTAQVDSLTFVNKSANGDAAPEGTSERAIEDLVDQLDDSRGVLLSSSYEFPGRYARWSLGFVNPPLEVSGKGQHCTISALNQRGNVLLPAIIQSMEQLKTDGILEDITVSDDKVEVKVVPPSEVGSFSEEDRSRQPSLFSVVRSLVDLFGYEDGDGQLGLYGAFGYDLTFQFEPIDLKQERDPDQRDILLYLPDEIVVVDQEDRKSVV